MRSICIALAIMSSPAALSAQPAMTKLDAVAGIPKIDNTTQTEDVGFSSGTDDRMTVPVRLSGYGPFRFLVDTGADRTAISRELADSLGLRRGETVAVHTVTGVTAVSTANVPSLQLTRKPVRIAEAPLLETANMGADGIIGVDSLRSQSVLFDFEKQTLSIVPSAVASLPNEPDTIVVEGTRKNGRMILTDASANDHPVTVVIDTGAQLSIGNEALREQLLGGQLTDTSQKVQVVSVTGAVLTGDYMLLHELTIGGLKLKNLAILFADAHAFKELKLKQKPALLLGMNAIRAFKKVSIDFANRKFRVVLPEESALDVRFAAARLR